MAISEALGTAKVVQLRPAPQIEGLEVVEISAAEFLEVQNGFVKEPVPHVKGELCKPMVGTVPADWSLS